MTDQRNRSPTPDGILVDAVESFALQPVQDADKGPRKITGVAKKADHINLNRRFFSLAVLTAMSTAAQDAVKNGELYGLVQHPDPWHEGPKGLIENIGIKYDRLWMDGKLLKFEGRLVGTDQGKNLQAVLDAEIKVGMSTNVKGSAKYLPAKEVDPEWPDPEETIQVVNDDARLITIDAVMGPADLAGELNAADSVGKEPEVKNLAELKEKYPDVYAQAVAEGKAQASTDGASVEQQLATERAARLKLEKDIQDSRRREIASKALTDAKLPKLGKSGDIDLDARFQKRVTDAALNAESDDEARTEVSALIAERKISTSTNTDKDNNPGLGDDGVQDAAKQRNSKTRSTFMAARRNHGL